MNNLQKSKFTFSPLIVTTLIIVIDQLSKYLITIFIPVDSYADIKKVLGDFLWIIHVRNTGAVFSLLAESESYFRIIMLFIIPIILILYLLYASILMKWHMRFKLLTATIAGGGIGNMIDRFSRPDGVVDFISVNMYGLFGMKRWPTFNIADTSITISMLLWMTFALLTKEQKHTVVNTNSEKDKNQNKK